MIDGGLPSVMIHKIKIVLFSVHFYVKKTGGNVAVYNGHTFSRNYDSRNKFNERWPCTNKTSRCCKAVITMTKTREIVRANLNHNHPPQKYAVFDGLYYRC